MPCASKVCAFHFGLLISSMLTGVPSCSESSASAASRLLQEMIARLLGGVLIDADAAPAHLQHHRHQVDFEPIGVARPFLIQDRIELLEQLERGHRIGFGIGADKARRQLARCAP